MNRTLALMSLLLPIAACKPAVDAELTAAIDRQAIEQLIAGDYPRALDSSNWDAYADQYTADGELLLLGQSAKGREAIIAFLKALPADTRVVHVITNLSYAIQGDTATGGAYWQDVGMVGDAPGVLAAGHYEDTLRKTNGEWKIAKRSIVVDFAPPSLVSSAAPPSQ